MAQDPLLVEYHRSEGLLSLLLAIVHRVELDRVESLLALSQISTRLNPVVDVCKSHGLFEAFETKLFGAAVLNKLDEEHSDADPLKQLALPLSENSVLLSHVSPLVQVL